MWHYVYTPCTKKTLGFPAVATTQQKWIFFADHNGTKIYFGGEDIFKLLCWTLEFWISHSRREERRMRFFSSLDALERCNFAKEKHSNASLGASLECRGAARLTIFAQKKLKAKGEQNLHFNSLSQNCPKNSIFCQITVWIFALKFMPFTFFFNNWSKLELWDDDFPSSVFWHFEWIYAALFQMTLADSMNPNALVTTSFFPVLEYLGTRKSKADGMNTYFNCNFFPDSVWKLLNVSHLNFFSRNETFELMDLMQMELITSIKCNFYTLYTSKAAA